MLAWLGGGGVELAGRDLGAREDLLAHEVGHGPQERLEVLASRGEASQYPDLNVFQAGVTQQARGARAGMEVPIGSRVDVSDFGQQQLPGGMGRVDGPGRRAGR
jgi:hypothetical protein